MIEPTPHIPPAPGEGVEVAPGVLWLRMPLPFKPDFVNCYALDDEDGWTVVDTGVDTPNSRAIWQSLIQGPLAGRPVRRLIVTHHHADHVGLAGWFVAQGAELLISRTAWLMARMALLDVQDSATPQTIAFWRAAGLDEETVARKSAERPFNLSDIGASLPQGFTRLTDNQTITFGRRRWSVRMGDGHAPEHATFWSQDDDLVIGGDQLLASISPNLGVHPNEPGADPIGEWLQSCARLSPHARADQLILPGHRQPYRGLPTRLRQLMENERRGQERLAAGLAAKPRTTVECLPLLYRRRIGDGELRLALAEATAHINHLHRAGRIRPQGITPTGGVLWGT